MEKPDDRCQLILKPGRERRFAYLEARVFKRLEHAERRFEFQVQGTRDRVIRPIHAQESASTL